MKGFKKFLVLALASVLALACTVDAYALNSPYYGVYNFLTSGARTTAQTSADQTGLYTTGINLVCNITAASGTGGLTFKLQGKDPLSGAYYDVGANLAIVTAGTVVVNVGEGIWNTTATTTSANVNQYMPYIWRIAVAVGDASSYTYSCSYVLRSSS